MAPGVTVVPNGQEKREVGSTSLTSLTEGHSPRMSGWASACLQEYLDTPRRLTRRRAPDRGLDGRSRRSEPEGRPLF